MYVFPALYDLFLCSIDPDGAWNLKCVGYGKDFYWSRASRTISAGPGWNLGGRIGSRILKNSVAELADKFLLCSSELMRRPFFSGCDALLHISLVDASQLGYVKRGSAPLPRLVTTRQWGDKPPTGGLVDLSLNLEAVLTFALPLALVICLPS